MKGKMQKQVDAFVRRNGMKTDVSFRVLDLVSEIGEVAKEVLKSTNYGRKSFTPGENWSAELGDVLFSLACVANSTGIDLDKALAEVLEKYQDRIRKTKQAGSSR